MFQEDQAKNHVLVLQGIRFPRILSAVAHSWFSNPRFALVPLFTLIQSLFIDADVVLFW